MVIENGQVYTALTRAGFHRPRKDRPTLFVVDDSKSVSGAYYCALHRRQRMVRFGGGIGLYFKDFERMWENSVSSDEKRLDHTLPIILAIGNFMPLIDSGALDFFCDMSTMFDNAKNIHTSVFALPQSFEELSTSLSMCALLDIPINEYLHLFYYSTDESLYFRKSKTFISWLADSRPEIACLLYGCLTAHQKARL